MSDRQRNHDEIVAQLVFDAFEREVHVPAELEARLLATATERPSGTCELDPAMKGAAQAVEVATEPTDTTLLRRPGRIVAIALAALAASIVLGAALGNKMGNVEHVGTEPSGSSNSSNASEPRQQSVTPAPHCPVGMALVQGGAFDVGPFAGAMKRGLHVADFCMDASEVTVRAYSACVASNTCRPPRSDPQCNWGVPGRDDHPVNCVDWDQASRFCSTFGARLPTEEEWEYAARGGRRYLRFSWGDEVPSGDALCWKGSGTCRAKSFPAGAFGLYDMNGNVAEWTSTFFCPYTVPAENCSRRIGIAVRGGSWKNQDVDGVSSTHRMQINPRMNPTGIGFRCARSVDE